MDDVILLKPDELFLATPLYEVISWPDESVFDVVNILYYRGSIDSYCIDCGRESTFRAVQAQIPEGFSKERHYKLRAIGGNQSFPILPSGTHEVNFTCARNGRHKLVFIFLISRNATHNKLDKLAVNSIQKIGQYPSYGDLNIPKLKDYSSVLSKEAKKEFVKAIGLASHGVGVGSYVYLRRIFENQVEEAHKVASEGENWNEETYTKSRMNEKIQLLRGVLPEFLVDHPEMYGLLSKGIHEMSEQDCLEHFDVLKIAIELILDEKLEMKMKENKLKDAKKAIKKAVEKVSAKNV